VARHEVFGKSFARFKPGRISARANYRQAARFEIIYNAGRQRRFSANERQVYWLLLSEPGQRRNVIGAYGNTLSDLPNPRIAGGAEQLHSLSRTLAEGPNQSVFAAARTDDQNVHLLPKLFSS